MQAGRQAVEQQHMMHEPKKSFPYCSFLIPPKKENKHTHTERECEEPQKGKKATHWMSLQAKGSKLQRPLEYYTLLSSSISSS